jgi:hypothetical protein
MVNGQKREFLRLSLARSLYFSGINSEIRTLARPHTRRDGYIEVV